MITQRLMLDINDERGPSIYVKQTERGLRQVVFVIVRRDEDGNRVEVDIPAGASGELRIVKPSKQFVIIDMAREYLESGTTVFTATIPEQAGAVGGVGYYDIRIYESNSEFAFTAQGNVLIDDNVLNSEMIEDVSEVGGLVFPDDFLTTEDLTDFAKIDDAATSPSSVWSSYKTQQEISEAISSVKTLHEYSMQEEIVGEWIDGNPVYEKVIVTEFGEYVSNINIPLASDPIYVIDCRVYVDPSDSSEGLIPAWPSIGFAGSVTGGDGGSLYGSSGLNVNRSGPTAYGLNPRVIVILRYYRRINNAT